MLQATDAFPRGTLHPRRGRQRGSGERRPPSRSAFLSLAGAGIAGEPGSPEQRRISGWRELGSPEQYRIIRWREPGSPYEKKS